MSAALDLMEKLKFVQGIRVRPKEKLEGKRKRGKKNYYSLSYLPPPAHITPSSLNLASPLRIAAPRHFKMAAAHTDAQTELSSGNPQKKHSH